MLEGLEVEAGAGGAGLEGDRYLQYPVMLERALMEGSYDKVWEATRREGGAPGEEFGVFSEVSRNLGLSRARVGTSAWVLHVQELLSPC